MITKIVLKDIATFDHEGITLEDLQKVNFVYGGNGCGKTTLSRVVEHPELFPSCEVTWDDDPQRVLVYNKDFRKRNLGEHIPGVFTLGEATVDEANAIKEKQAEMQRKMADARGKKEKIDKIKEAIAEEEAQLQEWLWYNVYKKNEGFKECVRGYMLKENFKNRILEVLDIEDKTEVSIDNSNLKERYKTLFGGNDPQRMHPFTTPIGVLQQATAISGHEIWKRRIVGSKDVPIAALIEKLGNADWVRQGQGMLEKSGNQCPFCQKGTIDEAFKKQLDAFFDEHYLNDLKTIADLKAQYVQLVDGVIDQLLAIEEKEKKEKTGKLDLDLFAANVKLLEEGLRENCQKMETKADEPGVSLTFADTRETEATLKGLTDKANAAISAHNDMVDNIVNERNNLKRDVWFYLAALGENEVKRVRSFAAKKGEEIKKLTEQGKAAQDEALKIKGQIEESEKKLTGVEPTIKSINRSLRGFGFTGFSIQPSPAHENYYQIQREDGSFVEDTLSEGEVTFITFLYYMHLVQGGETTESILQPRVLVIDDPISSLDSNVLFVVSTLVKDMIGKVFVESDIKQVIVLTHNVFFHKQVSFIPNYLRKRYPYRFWVMFKRGNVTGVKDFGDENPVKSEYELSWKKLRDWRDKVVDMDSADMQNTIRRIIDTYFVMFGGYDKRTLFDGKFEEAEEMTIVNSLAKWTDEGSHDLPESLFVESPHITNEKYMVVFRKMFDRMGHLEHYKMMMGEEN